MPRPISGAEIGLNNTAVGMGYLFCWQAINGEAPPRTWPSNTENISMGICRKNL